MAIWFVIIKKREFVELILIGYTVLMITNTNDILLECVDQQVPHSGCARIKSSNLYYSRTGWKQDLNVE